MLQHFTRWFIKNIPRHLVALRIPLMKLGLGRLQMPFSQNCVGVVYGPSRGGGGTCRGQNKKLYIKIYIVKLLFLLCFSYAVNVWFTVLKLFI
jgi:hypothetical protein